MSGLRTRIAGAKAFAGLTKLHYVYDMVLRSRRGESPKLQSWFRFWLLGDRNAGRHGYIPHRLRRIVIALAPIPARRTWDLKWLMLARMTETLLHTLMRYKAPKLAGGASSKGQPL